ncbi:heavy metal sensor histidine kinase [Diaphorobacter ruginosibacter]|uniref:heavy metal sensor histidine kinase n=1 Tax=Diaphorobacter ruginosibacter TaxID=1715720 RepID=UPI0033420737
MSPQANEAAGDTRARHRSWSISARLAAMFAVTAALIFAFMAAALYRVLDKELDHYLHEQMQGRLGDVRYMLEHGRSPQLAEHAKGKMAEMERSDPRTHFWLWSTDPRYRYGEDAQEIAQLARRTSEIRTPKGALTLLSTDIAANDIRPAMQLVIGSHAGAILENTLHNFRNALVALTAMAVLLVAALGYWIAVVGLKPVKQLSSEAERIGRNRDSERLRLPVLPPELMNLAGSFNAALDRLNAAYQQLETFNADVAHELRTPVANMIGQTQVVLSRERSAPQLREVLQSNLEELERLRGLVAAMLFLARAEQGERAHDLVAASLAAEMSKIVDFFEMVLDDAGMRVEISGDAQVSVQTSLLRRALSNLLQNAIQHASDGGKAITVRVSTLDSTTAELTISNTSEPLAEDQLRHLFDRFYRVDVSRRNSVESHGLGLAIVKAVALMHSGEVLARQSGGQLSIVLRLPRADG